MTKQEQQINELNSTIKAKIAPSKIHGVGVVAIRYLYKGEQLHADKFPRMYDLSYSNFGKLFPEVKELILERWPRVINGEAKKEFFISPDVRLLTFMNHSDDPNYDAKTDTLLKDVKFGEEITENYKLMENWEKVFTWLN